MKVASPFALLACALFVGACSSTPSPGPIGEGDAGTSPGPTPGGPVPPGASGPAGGDGGGGSSGPAILCESRDQSCVCGKDKSWIPNGSPTTPCSRATTSADAWCCASNDWPGAGGCSCTPNGANCHRTPSKTCICGLAKPGAGDTPVTSCTGKLCCNDPGNIAPNCACYENLTQCVFGTPVPSCDVSSLKCQGHKIDSCR